MPDYLGFIKEDWQKIPQNVRYYILTGAALLAIAWIADKVGIDPKYKLLFWDFRELFFNLGVFLILAGLLMLLLKQIWLPLKLIYYRWRYPLKNLNTAYFLIRFNDRIILFDRRKKNKKRSYHVHPLGTARDLSFNTHALHILRDFDEARVNNGVIGKRGDVIYIKVKDYKYIGLINTRR